MNPEQLLQKVAAAVSARKPSVTDRYFIYYAKGQFHCEPVQPQNLPDITFGQFTDKELKDGLTVGQWGKIASKIAKSKKEIT